MTVYNTRANAVVLVAHTLLFLAGIYCILVPPRVFFVHYTLPLWPDKTQDFYGNVIRYGFYVLGGTLVASSLTAVLFLHYRRRRLDYAPGLFIAYSMVALLASVLALGALVVSILGILAAQRTDPANLTTELTGGTRDPERRFIYLTVGSAVVLVLSLAALLAALSKHQMKMSRRNAILNTEVNASSMMPMDDKYNARMSESHDRKFSAPPAAVAASSSAGARYQVASTQYAQDAMRFSDMQANHYQQPQHSTQGYASYYEPYTQDQLQPPQQSYDYSAQYSNAGQPYPNRYSQQASPQGGGSGVPYSLAAYQAAHNADPYFADMDTQVGTQSTYQDGPLHAVGNRAPGPSDTVPYHQALGPYFTSDGAGLATAAHIKGPRTNPFPDHTHVPATPLVTDHDRPESESDYSHVDVDDLEEQQDRDPRSLEGPIAQSTSLSGTSGTRSNSSVVAGADARSATGDSSVAAYAGSFVSGSAGGGAPPSATGPYNRARDHPILEEQRERWRTER
ncbi:hypothetical protein HKX48_002323 [Thoreauomyces humboldtii]|nr:hypothetical protein HKX48_002323 [Thoreauomyces humboldtii]